MASDSTSTSELILEDWDFDPETEFDEQEMRIINDSPSTSTKIFLHHDLVKELEAIGFEELHLTFIPDAVPEKVSSLQPQQPEPKPSEKRIRLCPSCGRTYTRQAYLQKHIEICCTSTTSNLNRAVASKYSYVI